MDSSFSALGSMEGSCERHNELLKKPGKFKKMSYYKF
jgi:hypothetical protein